MSDVKEHVETINVHEVMVIPGHIQRVESAEFRKSKERLIKDGHHTCWICGSTVALQVHHFAVEWAEAGVADFLKMKAFVEEWDPYGYGRLLRNKPITTVDDVRNMLVLCQEHHTGSDSVAGNSTGIHNCTFPLWIIQKLCIAGLDPVPEEGETLAQVEERISKISS